MPRPLKDSYVGPFVIIKLHGPNAVEVALTGEFERKPPTSPVSLLKMWVEPKEKFPKRVIPEEQVIPLEEDGEKIIDKVLQHKHVKKNNKDISLYLVRYKQKGSDYDEWLEEKDLGKNTPYFRTYRASKRGIQV